MRINKNTLFLMFDGVNTILKEEEKEYRVLGNEVKKILNDSCIYYGSSLLGRIKGSKNLLQGRYKLPVVISERNNIIFFPIKDGDDIVWLNFKNIISYKRLDKAVEVTFINNYKKCFNSTITVFNNQLLKCSRLWLVFLGQN